MVYETDVFVVVKLSRAFWYNFEVIRREIKRLMRAKRQKRYKFKQKKKIKVKIRNAYVRKYKYAQRVMWISGLNWLPLSMKPKGSRMGKGVGGFKKWYSLTTWGFVLFKIHIHKNLVNKHIGRKVAKMDSMRHIKIKNYLLNKIHLVWHW